MIERVEKVALLYIQSHYDVKSLTLPELIKLFDNTCDEILDVIKENKLTNKN